MAVKGAADWYLSDQKDFEFGIDACENHSACECVYFKSIVSRPKKFGFLSKSLDASTFVGKRLKLSAWLKTSLADGASAQLWLRVDGDWKERPGCFDNMYERRVQGQTEWASYVVFVDVPEGSRQVVYGVLLNGTGQLWFSDVQLEPAS